jgi:ABC-type lipopolysaccharide export system ATPase subunit
LALLLDIPLERKKDLMGLIMLSQLSSVFIAVHVRQWIHVHAPTQVYSSKKKKQKKKNQKPIERQEIPLTKLTKRPKDTIWMH